MEKHGARCTSHWNTRSTPHQGSSLGQPASHTGQRAARLHRTKNRRLNNTSTGGSKRCRESKEKGRPRGHTPRDGCKPRSSRFVPSLSAPCAGAARATPTPSWPKRAFSKVACALGWAYHTLMDSSMACCTNSVPSVWGVTHSIAAWRWCENQPPTFPEPPAPISGCAPIQADSPLYGTNHSRRQVAVEPASSRWTAPRRLRGGAPFSAVPRRGGTSCRTRAPRRSSWGHCPCGALIYPAAGHC